MFNNLMLIIMFSVGIYAMFHYMKVTDPISEPCPECNAESGEPCRPYCIGIDSEL